MVSTQAGIGMGMTDAGFSGDGGQASLAQLNVPFDVAEDAFGNIFFTDKFNHRIRRIDTLGVITTIAGTGTAGFSGDGGLATSENLDRPSAIAFDGSGNLLFMDTEGTRIRKIDASGNITTIAGTGITGFFGDGGSALSAQFDRASDIVVHGNDLYIADTYNHRVRMINATGNISTIAGTGTTGFSGDGGQTELNIPLGIAVDNTGAILIASDHRIRRIAPGTNIITTIAGDGGTDYTDGPALSRSLATPSDLAIDNTGNIYFAEIGAILNPFSGRKLRVLSSGMVSTVMAGWGFGGIGHGGVFAAAMLNSVRGLIIDQNGSILLADPDDSRIVSICNNNDLATNAHYVRPALPDNTSNLFTAMKRCDIICTSTSLGTAPLTGEIAYQVTVDESVQTYKRHPYAQRHYDIVPVSNLTAATGMLTFYYKQDEFEAYNIVAGQSFYPLPSGPADAAGIAALRIVQYKGTGTIPGTYTGTADTLDPTDNNIVWNPLLSRWEVTVSVTGMGGFYLQTEAYPLSVNNVNKKHSANVFPAASSGKVTIETKPDLSGSLCTLTGIDGREMFRFRLGSARQELDISYLPSGIYLLQVQHAGVYKIIRN